MMEELNTQTILELAELARLNIDEEHALHFVKDLSCLLDMVKTIREIDVSGVQDLNSLASTIDADLLRPDRAIALDERAAWAQIAPQFDSETGLFLVPKVIE